MEQLQITTKDFQVDNNQKERMTLSIRLTSALRAKGIRPSPTVVSNGFNLFSGNEISPHTARNWLLGKAFPTHEKLVALGKWLDVSPSELRYGHEVGKTMMFETTTGEVEITNADRKMIEMYLGLPLVKKEIIRDIVEAYEFRIAA